VPSNTANTVVTTRDKSNVGNALYGIDNTVCMVWNCLGYRGRSKQGCFMAASCAGYPQRVRHELTELIQKQIDSIEKERYSGATDAERREYEGGGSVLMNYTPNSSA
jgi:hypothetical protein